MNFSEPEVLPPNISRINKQPKIKKLALLVTEKCNKKCWYCNFPQIKKPKDAPISLITKYIPYLETFDSFDFYTITGGEPGLIDPVIFDYLFNTISIHPIRINTNGEFVKRGYFQKYYHYLDIMGLHATIDLEDIPEELVLPFEEFSKVWYYIPIHSQNYKYIQTYLYRYENLQFSLIEFQNKWRDKPKYEKYRLTQDMYKEIYDKIYRLPNIADCCKLLFYRLGFQSKTVREQHRHACSIGYIQPVINFATKKIQHCVNNYTDSSQQVELNTPNLKSLLHYQLFQFYDIDCDGCDDAPNYFEYFMRNCLRRSKNR